MNPKLLSGHMEFVVHANACAPDDASNPAYSPTGERPPLVELRAPTPGIWRGGPEISSLVSSNGTLGTLEVLGQIYTLRVPDGAQGLVVESVQKGLAQSAVEAGQRLAVLAPLAAADNILATDEEAAIAQVAGLQDESLRGARVSGTGKERLVFVAPSSGRFFARPTPHEDPFIAEGQAINAGATVGLLEVMKTFHRIHYGGKGLPLHAQVGCILVQDGEDLEAGQALFEIERTKPSQI